jgi:DNA-binding NarL/FixJ family response regulator
MHSYKIDELPSMTITQRHKEVLEDAAHGLTDKQIAKKRYIGERTVKRHLAQIRGRLGAKNTTQAVYVALKIGAID